MSHSTAFPVKDGKVVYGPTSDGLRREYTLSEFKKTIQAIVNSEGTQEQGPEQGGGHERKRRFPHKIEKLNKHQ